MNIRLICPCQLSFMEFSRQNKILRALGFYLLFSHFSTVIFSNELVWPLSDYEPLFQPQFETDSRVQLYSTWPRSSRSFCQTPGGTNKPFDSQNNNLCSKMSTKKGFRFTANLFSDSHFKKYPMGDSLDNMGSSSGKILALKVNPENGRKWHYSPSFITMNSKYTFAPGLMAYLKINFRKTYDAWFEDDLALNVPKSTDDLDINIPTLGYIHLGKKYLELTIGRFPVHWSPSSKFGMTLSSSSPFYNGIYGVLKGTSFSYHYLVAGMDAWLSGTPASLGDSIPFGSEEYINWNPDYLDYPSNNYNARNKFYADPYKTFTAHRVQFATSMVIAGLTEVSMIGGKSPSLRDVVPMVARHNNYDHGFTNTGTGVDLNLRLPGKFQLKGELFIDDLKESDHAGSPSSIGLMGEIQHEFTIIEKNIQHSLTYAQTDPFLYNDPRPLLKLTNRNVIKSNYLPQGSDPFTDTYVIDYPVGYLRGPDARDLWYFASIGWTPRITFKIMLAWLQQGDKTTHSLFTDTGEDVLTGIIEREFRSFLETYFQLNPLMGVKTGYGLQALTNSNHRKGNDALHQSIFGGFRVQF